MDYLFVFLVGLASFISPYILHSLPIYFSYLLGNEDDREDIKGNLEEEKEKDNESEINPDNINIIVGRKPYKISKKEIKDNQKKGITNIIGFIIGFTAVFLILSIIAKIIGNALNFDVRTAKIILGIIIIFIGVGYIFIFPANKKFLNKLHANMQRFSFLNFGTSLLFGLVVSISWIPYVWPFLCCSLLLISQESVMIKSISLILIYSLGITIPLVISALIINKKNNNFELSEKSYFVLKIICGIVLILMGAYVIFKP